jgi:RNase H-fold protein (predicted Holliday junction resolvase)
MSATALFRNVSYIPTGSEFLAKLPPMKSVLCIVVSPTVGDKKADWMIGTAISDPYLGYATPLETVSTTSTSISSNLMKLVLEYKPGGLAFGLPMIATLPETSSLQSKYLKDREFFVQTLIRQHPHPQTVTTATTKRDDTCLELDAGMSLSYYTNIDERLSTEESYDRKATEWEMWEDIDDPGDAKLSTQAAVSLNAWLWTNCGGWRNTFG